MYENVWCHSWQPCRFSETIMLTFSAGGGWHVSIVGFLTRAAEASLDMLLNLIAVWVALMAVQKSFHCCLLSKYFILVLKMFILPRIFSIYYLEADLRLFIAHFLLSGCCCDAAARSRARGFRLPMVLKRFIDRNLTWRIGSNFLDLLGYPWFWGVSNLDRYGSDHSSNFLAEFFVVCTMILLKMLCIQKKVVLVDAYSAANWCMLLSRSLLF